MLQQNSVQVPEHVLRMAEDLNTYLPLSPGDHRHETPEFVLWMGPTSDPHHNVVQRLRIEDGALPAAVERARALFKAHGRHQATWEVGNSATPKNLAEQLMEIGMVPDDPDPVATGMVLKQELAPSRKSNVFAKRVETLAEYVACCEIVENCFGTPPDDNIQREFDQLKADHQKTRWIALLDGSPVAMADATHLEFATVLNGGATLPDARGKGAYRALLAARYEEAKRRGAPMLITQAGAMSRPILQSLGLEVISRVQIFVDNF